jgi:hypothetical protein
MVRIFKTVVVVAMAIMFTSLMAWAKIPKSTILNSAHDFRTQLNGASFTLCNFCHVAHKTGPSPTGPGPLLWNHTQSSVASYGVYTSDYFAGLNTDIADVGGLSTSSNMCLGCHDGTVAVNSWYEPVTGANFQPLPQGTIFVTGNATIRDLSKTHPINFTYNSQLATKSGVLQPNGLSSVDAAGEIPLYNGKMQCGTCHDPHNGGSSIFERNFPTQASGTFCTYCHL